MSGHPGLMRKASVDCLTGNLSIDFVEQSKKTNHRVREPCDPIQLLVGAEMAADKPRRVAKVDGGSEAGLAAAGKDHKTDARGWCHGETVRDDIVDHQGVRLRVEITRTPQGGVKGPPG